MFKIIFILSLISFIKPACEDIKPNIFSDCVVDSDPLNYCCYAYSSVGKKCVRKSRAQWKSTDRITHLADNTQYILDCGVASTFTFNSTDVNYAIGIPKDLTNLNNANQGLPDVGMSCGPQRNNVTLDDCKTGSYPFNGCCLYEFGDKRSCFLLGKTYDGNLTYGKITVTCSSDWNRMYLVLLLLVLLIFI
jgi:hypothetical protein